ncbi:hypothetical protein WJX72_010262 [[Myrmecia] bisecta]|uniref:Ubiquinone biosynthesis O-methyltransferase, mitochondrial n=1 Tax=[Myrmecia] bisecta TaxID=41462 RepID=A0AAW1Q493_9CHLO
MLACGVHALRLLGRNRVQVRCAAYCASGASQQPEQDEVTKFSKLSGDWWDPKGPFGGLHEINPLRCKFIKDAICAQYGLEPHSPEPLVGLSVLDVGTGGGLLAEALARLGAQVTGVDLSPQSVAAAHAHARQDPAVSQRTRFGAVAIEQLQAAGAHYDAVIASEVVEHVQDPSQFLAALSSTTRTPGVVVISTLNRTAQSYALAIAAAEYLTGMVPKGTHDWKSFITPAELSLLMRRQGFQMETLAGMVDVIDPNYRKALQLDPDRFATTFDLAAHDILDDIASVMMPEASHVRALLYKLNIYRPGDHFKVHVDTPRSTDIFGSLVVCLPCEHMGGQLVVMHDGASITYDWGTKEGAEDAQSRAPNPIQWAAIYSDCGHLIKEVQSGFRIMLTYNLWTSKENCTFVILRRPYSVNAANMANTASVDACVSDLRLSKPHQLAKENVKPNGAQAEGDICIQYLHPTSASKLSLSDSNAGRSSRLLCKNNVAATETAHWKPQEDEDVVLVADIGGTNCRFMLWLLDFENGKDHVELFSKKYATKDYPTFPDALKALSHEEVFKKHTPKTAAFACAGPVVDNKCVMTNLDWTIDGHYLTAKYGIRMAVLNDFEAAGYGIPALKPEDVVVLNEVPVMDKAPKAVMGPGTGLGEANLFWDENFGSYRVWPSEGSHATFAPRGWKQRALQAFVEQELGYCELEHVACGSGLERIYRFLQSDEKCNRPQSDLITELDAPSITKAALCDSDPLAVEAVDMFLSIVAAEAGQMGLRSLATGGVYICGGVTPRLMDRVDMGGVMDAFLHKKSRFNKLLRTFPLYLVVNEGLGLLGTREYAIRLLTTPEVCKET